MIIVFDTRLRDTEPTPSRVPRHQVARHQVPRLLDYTIPKIMKMRSEAFESGFVEHLLELGMRHRDNEFGSFLQRASVKVHCTIFGDEPVDVVARGDGT